MLEIKNIYKTYASKNGVTHRALENVSLKFGKTGLVFILGKSGSGKSTLLNILGGLDDFDRGDVIFNGKSFKEFKNADFDYYRNSCIGFIFQDFNLLNNLTVFDNVSLALDLQSKKDDKLVNDILIKVGVESLKNRKTDELSGGQKQRVAIARALIKNPSIILADEPTGSLDSENSDAIIKLLQELSKDRLVLVVTHNRDLAYDYGNRIIEIRDGFVLKDFARNQQIVNDFANLSVSNVVKISKGGMISDAEIDNFNAAIKEKNQDYYLLIENDKRRVMSLYPNIKEVLDSSNNQENFKPYIYNEEDNKTYGKPIKSNIPLKKDIKLGFSNIKKKRIKLFFTILLTILAVVLTGVASNFTNYNLAKSVGTSISKDNTNYLEVSSSFSITDSDYELQDTELNYLESLNKKMAIAYNNEMTFSYNEGDGKADLAMANDPLFPGRVITGFLQCDDIETYKFKGNNFKIIEKMNEITESDLQKGAYISSILANTIIRYNSYSKYKYYNSYKDLIGSNITVKNSILNEPIKVLGIYDIDEDQSLYYKFEQLREYDIPSLQNEYNNISDSILLRLVVSSSFVENYKNSISRIPFSYQTTNINNFAIKNSSGSNSSISTKGYIFNSGLLDIDDYSTKVSFFDPNWNQGNYLTMQKECDTNYIIVGKNFIKYAIAKDYTETDGFMSEETKSLIALWNSQNHKLTIKDNNSQAEGRTIYALENVKIVGVVTRNSGKYGDSSLNSIYLSENGFSYILNEYIRPSKVLLEMNEQDNYSKAVQSLYDNGFTINNYSVSYLKSFVKTIGKYSKIINVIAFIWFVIVGILLYSFMSNSVKNNAKQIGILKALGANIKDIAKIFTVEAIYIGIFTLVFGISFYYFGGLLANSLVTKYLWTFYYPIFLGEVSNLIGISILTIVILAVALIIPMFKIKSIKPIDVMNNN